MEFIKKDFYYSPSNFPAGDVRSSLKPYRDPPQSHPPKNWDWVHSWSFINIFLASFASLAPQPLMLYSCLPANYKINDIFFFRYVSASEKG